MLTDREGRPVRCVFCTEAATTTQISSTDRSIEPVCLRHKGRNHTP